MAVSPCCNNCTRKKKGLSKIYQRKCPLIRFFIFFQDVMNPFPSIISSTHFDTTEQMPYHSTSKEQTKTFLFSDYVFIMIDSFNFFQPLEKVFDFHPTVQIRNLYFHIKSIVSFFPFIPPFHILMQSKSEIDCGQDYESQG